MHNGNKNDNSDQNGNFFPYRQKVICWWENAYMSKLGLFEELKLVLILTLLLQLLLLSNAYFSIAYVNFSMLK